MQSNVEPMKVKGYLSVFNYVVDKPQSLAILFALCLLGMFFGILPSQLENNQRALMDGQREILSNQEASRLSTQTRYDSLQEQLRTQNTQQSEQTDKMIQIMRGMCLIIAKQSADSSALSYCNP